MPDGRLCSGHECCTVCHQQPAKIHRLRSTTREVLENARAVFHYSQSTKAEFTRILDGHYPWQYIEHGVRLPAIDRSPAARANDFAKPSADVPLKVAFLGAIGANKGANLIRQIVNASDFLRACPFSGTLSE